MKELLIPKDGVNMSSNKNSSKKGKSSALTELAQRLKVSAISTTKPTQKRNSFEGGYPEFWDNDIDSELDDAWAKAVSEGA